MAATSESKAAVRSDITSSKLLKTAQGSVDETGVLNAVAALPVDRWRYTAETGLSQQVHIGPYAEDFKASFGVGDGVTINTTDALGVCLAAIKALAARVETLEAELREKSGEEKEVRKRLPLFLHRDGREADMPQRAIWKKLGRYAAVTPSVLLAAAKRAAAITFPSSRRFKNPAALRWRC
jgi:hypothetical protein